MEYSILERRYLNKREVILEQGKEFLFFPEVYGESECFRLNVKKSEVCYFIFKNAMITAFSDVIRLENGVFYNKTCDVSWYNVIRKDSDLVEEPDDVSTILTLEKPKDKNIKYYDEVLSLCGVAFQSWSHFVVNYLPKLYYYEKLINENNLVLIAPLVKDSNIKELIDYYINFKFRGNVVVRYVKRNEYVYCKKLHYIENFSKISDHSKFCYNYSVIIPRIVPVILRNIVTELINKLKSKTVDNCKLFIKRGSDSRSLINSKDIESYFVKKGYHVVDCSNLNIEQKIHLFYGATHIVGELSSAFTNIIFCRSTKLKILGFINYSRCFDPFFLNLLDRNYTQVKCVYVPGHEIENFNINSNYMIDKNLIFKSAYENGF